MFCCLRVSTLPIRNGNTTMVANIFCNGLTPFLVSTLPIRNGNEIVIDLRSSLYSVSPCKYLTYKEWKRFSNYFHYSSCNHIVGALPIRNGNTKPSSIQFLTEYPVSTLPIRNRNGHADLNLLPRTVTP